MSKNSPKQQVHRLPSDGSVSPREISPALQGGGGGGAGGGGATEDGTRTFSFALDRAERSALATLKPGEAVAFAEESKSDIAVRRKGRTVGYVPRGALKRVRSVMANGGYSAEIEDISHESARVRVVA